MAFNRDNLGLGFDITGDSRDAIRALDAVEDKAKQTTASVQRLSIEQRNSAAFARKVVEDAQRIKSSPFARNLAAESREVEKRLDSIFGVSTRAAKGLDTFSDSARRGRSSIGQFIEAIAQGDPGELLGEIAQNGGAAGKALAVLAIAAAAAAAPIGLTTAKLIENERELSKLARDTKLSTEQLQGLQVVANLTGESVEDLAENYKKLSPEVRRMQESVKAAGATIDADLRQKIRESSLAFEELKLSGAGALNAIGRELLPEVTRLLQDVSGFIRENQAGFAAVGVTLAEVVAVARDYFSVLSSIANLLGGLKNLGPIVVRVALQTPIATAIQLGRDIRDTSTRKSDAFGTLGGAEDFGTATDTGMFDVPSLAKPKGGGGKKDISELDLEIRKLKVSQDEATRALNGTAEAAQRLFNITRQLHEAEKQRAALSLPRERAAQLAEIQNRERIALEEYAKRLKEVSDAGLKPIEELSRRINEENAETLRWIQEQEQAALQLRNLLVQTRLDREGILLDQRDARIQRLQQLGVSELTIRSEQLRLQEDAENLAFARRQEAHQRELQQIAAEFEDEEMRLEAQAAINRRFEAEERAHNERLRLIQSEQRAQSERANPLSDRSLFGENFANNVERFDGNKIAAAAQTAQDSFQKMSESIGTFGDIAGRAFDQFADGVGSMVENFVLLGSAGPDAMRKLTASILAQVARQAAVKAIYELASGFANLALAAFGVPNAAAAAVANFKAAALFGAVAAVAGVAGRAVAGDSFKSGGGAGGSGGSVGGAQQGLRLNREVFFGDRANNPVVVHLRGEYQPGIIVREVTQDYRRNGSTRQTYRNDISGEGFSVV